LILELASGVIMEFVRIPAGEFWMGSDLKKREYVPEDQQPRHNVTLDEYLIGKTPVTNQQYQVFVEMSGCQNPSHRKDGKIPQGKEQHPVVNVNWHDAVAFCDWAGRKKMVKCDCLLKENGRKLHAGRMGAYIHGVTRRRTRHAAIS